MIRKNNLALSTMAVLLFLVGCEGKKSSDKKSPKPLEKKEVKGTQCSDWTESLKKPVLKDCNLAKILSTDDYFHNEITKTLKVDNKLVVLTNNLINKSPKDKKVRLYDAKLDLNESLFIYDLETKAKKLLMNDGYIQDFTISKNKIYVLWNSFKSSIAQLSIYDVNGNLTFTSNLPDPGIREDACKFRCDSKYPELQHIIDKEIVYFYEDRHYNFMKFGKILVNDSTDDIIIYADTLFYNSGNIYSYRLNNNKLEQNFRRQVFHEIAAFHAVPIWLRGGTELFAFKRFAKHLDRKINLLPNGEILFTYRYDGTPEEYDELNISYTKDLVQALNPEDDIYLIKSLNLIKLNNKGEIVFSKAIHNTSDNSSTQLNPLTYEDDIYIPITRSMGSSNSSSIYKSYLLKISGVNGNLIRKMPINLYTNQLATHTAAAKLDSKGNIILTGRTGWGQNPSGMSTNNKGLLFVTKMNLEDETQQTKYIKFSNRKDLGTDLLINKDSLDLSVIYDGPSTHSADKDIRKGFQKSAIFKVNLSN